MACYEATAVAHSNIAFLKYWGNRNPRLRLPMNASLSMNLSEAKTVTTVLFDPEADEDRIVLDGETRYGAARSRVTGHLDLVRRRAGLDLYAIVRSTNTFPMGTGVASSASAFAALTLAAATAARLDLTPRELSALARRGSGSAARSVPGGFVEWSAADTDEGSFAGSIAPPEHWDLRDVIAVVSRRPKELGSTEGHAAAIASPFFEARLDEVKRRLPVVRRAIMRRDLQTLGPAIEAEAMSLHAVAMTGRPSVVYWSPETVRLLRQVATWRRQGSRVYFTLDAGPNVHLICEGDEADELEQELLDLSYVEETLHNRPAGPARIIDPAEGRAELGFHRSATS